MYEVAALSDACHPQWGASTEWSPYGKPTGGALLGAVVSSLTGSIYSMRAMVNFFRNAFNVVVSIFLVTFIAINLVQVGKFLLSSQGLI